MSTGSFIDAGILTSSVQHLSINLNSPILYVITYPNSIGYSGSVPLEIMPLPTQSISTSTVPTVGQAWPRGSW